MPLVINCSSLFVYLKRKINKLRQFQFPKRSSPVQVGSLKLENSSKSIGGKTKIVKRDKVFVDSVSTARYFKGQHRIEIDLIPAKMENISIQSQNYTPWLSIAYNHKVAHLFLKKNTNIRGRRRKRVNKWLHLSMNLYLQLYFLCIPIASYLAIDNDLIE